MFAAVQQKVQKVCHETNTVSGKVAGLNRAVQQFMASKAGVLTAPSGSDKRQFFVGTQTLDSLRSVHGFLKSDESTFGSNEAFLTSWCSR